MTEQLQSCPICHGDMVDIDGKLQCENLVYHKMTPELKKFFNGQWLGLKNIKVEILWKNQPISENQPTCDSCGAKIKGRHIQKTVAMHHISYRAHAVNKQGEYYEKLADVYERVRNGKIDATEAFRIERELAREYVLDRPATERPIGSTIGHVPLKCPKCEKKLGSITVNVCSNPAERPKQPTIMQYATLPKTEKELRLIKERFKIADAQTFEEWLKGEDLQDFIRELREFRENLGKIPYVRNVYRELTDLKNSISSTIDALQRELRTRPDQVYTLLKNPSLPVIIRD